MHLYRQKKMQRATVLHVVCTDLHPNPCPTKT